MESSHRDEERGDSSVVQPGRHFLRELDLLWSEFLSLSKDVVDTLEKSVRAVCEGQFDLIPEVENEEADSDRREVLIEQECLRILARYEPVASDLRRLATILKVNRDLERIADLALRIARRARKLSRDPSGLAMPETLKNLALLVVEDVRTCHDALVRGDAVLARKVIDDDNPIDASYRALRKDFKSNLVSHADQIDAWLILLNTARNLERIADHATGIAQTIVYLLDGVIIRHEPHKRPMR
jgi:phosphate transport system protein